MRKFGWFGRFRETEGLASGGGVRSGKRQTTADGDRGYRSFQGHARPRGASARRIALHVAQMSLCIVGLLALVGLLAAVSGQSAVALAHQAQGMRQHDASSVTLHITQPAPQSTTVEGPVGANVTVQGQAATAGDSYQLGYSIQSQGCASDFNAISAVQPLTVDTNGSFTATFAWPQDANSVGASYYVCAMDQTTATNPVAQSAEVFHVDAAAAPAITVVALDANGTPAPTSNSLVAGGRAQISGQNFFPAGDNLYVFLTPHQFSGPDNVPDNRLKKA
ncbi:MAG: hypothetical protein ABI068_07175, partial [Ktedonobacterales bacterium]